MLLRSKYREIEKQLGYRFRDKSLIEAALMHRSFRFENDGVAVDNQRLEFLGDSVLGFLVAAHLYERNPDGDEGVMTSLRSRVTSGKALADIADGIDLGSHLKVGKGEEMSGGRKRSSNLADALEAVLGAAYIDGGVKAAAKIFNRLIIPCIDQLNGDIWADNPKGKLQEYSQQKWRCGPKYSVVKRDGPQHAVIFTVEVTVSTGLTATGVGANKQEAEMAAAGSLLERIKADEI